MLKRFAQAMKWPNLGETLDTLKQRDADGNLDDISSDALAFFSGLVLPGVRVPLSRSPLKLPVRSLATHY